RRYARTVATSAWDSTGESSTIPATRSGCCTEQLRQIGPVGTAVHHRPFDVGSIEYGSEIIGGRGDGHVPDRQILPGDLVARQPHPTVLHHEHIETTLCGPTPQRPIRHRRGKSRAARQYHNRQPRSRPWTQIRDIHRPSTRRPPNPTTSSGPHRPLGRLLHPPFLTHHPGDEPAPPTVPDTLNRTGSPRPGSTIQCCCQ